MREILFRGLDIDGSKWHYGHYYKGVMSEVEPRIVRVIIVDGTFYHVIPETIGQYTGLKDKNGVRIFEGDIAKFVFKNAHIVFYEGGFGWVYAGGNLIEDFIPFSGHNSFPMVMNRIEIIGNIHQSPELLEATNN